MIRGAWMYRREDDAVLKICCIPKQNDKPCADSERAQKWRMSLASLLFFTVLLSDHLWLCAGVKLRSKDKNSRKNWNNATDGDHAVQKEGNCGVLLSSLTKSAAPSPHCTDAQNHQHLESACTTLHWKKTGAGSSFTTPNRSSLSPQLLLTYFRNFSLSFCGSYTISDLLVGMANPDGLNCSLQNMIWDLGSGGVDEEGTCSSCIQAYMRLDHHAQEKYEEFDFLFLKYLSEDYSVRSRTEDCKMAYKAWLCSEYFSATQSQCYHRIPCQQYCLEVQASCPFVLPDNGHLVYGGLSSFICTGLLAKQVGSVGPECCDVRWSDYRSAMQAACGGSLAPRRTSQPASAAARLHGNRVRLCVLVLILLHTVVTFSTVTNHSGVSLEALASMEDNSAREE
ncbi:NALCN channel auxiliary factor 2 isoform X1 [Brienomyrus brachyistius]|uniref:NALCN channel auxiliary factor 2 isoform X1 n=2 Tax=Brienomyrus brachyistius TaxID=42636 RepID=UPI0020B27F35|nr:NALCN channel auxiliary factor 2 isoform X1 [Brienomyrus brachyistius]